MKQNYHRTYTKEQLELVKEFELYHGLDESQIAFDGEDPTPIFDYTAISFLGVKLTDISDIDCWISSRDPRDARVTAKCRVVLPDGRTRSVEGSAAIGEVMHDSTIIESWMLAETVAQSRASRLGIRSVGINLLRAHKDFINSGSIAHGHTDHDPRKALYEQIHVLAEKLGFIADGDKSGYHTLLAESFAGKTSAKDLNDMEIHQFLHTLRVLDRVRSARSQTAAAV